MPAIDERIIDALERKAEFEEADIDFLFSQLGITPSGMQRERAKGFRTQVWHVAAEAGFNAATTGEPRLVEIEPA